MTLSTCPQVPLFQALPGLRVAQVAAGKQHSLALTEAGVYAWGDNRFGQLGVGKAVARSSTPRLVPGLGRAVGVACGQFHSLARDEEGRVMTWGWGVHGQLGLGGIEDSGRPMLVRALANHRVVHIGAGYAHSVMLTRYYPELIQRSFLALHKTLQPRQSVHIWLWSLWSTGHRGNFQGCAASSSEIATGPKRFCKHQDNLQPGDIAGPLQSALLWLLPLCCWTRSRDRHGLGKQPPGVISNATVFTIPLNFNCQVLRLEAQQRKKERQAARKAEEKRLEEEEVNTLSSVLYNFPTLLL